MRSMCSTGMRNRLTQFAFTMHTSTADREISISHTVVLLHHICWRSTSCESFVRHALYVELFIVCLLSLMLHNAVVITTFKPKPKPTKQQDPLPSGKKPKPTRSQLIAEMKFDLLVTRVSFALDILSHTLVSFSSTASTSAAQIAFAGFTVLSSFGSGAYPNIQSLALCIQQAHAAEEGQAKSGGTESSTMGTGSLFGALAVIQATGQMILGVSIHSTFFHA